MLSHRPKHDVLRAPGALSAGAGEDSWSDLASSSIETSSAESSSALALSRLRDVRVFVVAADPQRRSALARVLQGLGLGVEAGAPDESGYRAAIAFHPDAIVSELTKPGEPGWWLLQRLRRHPLLRWVPVLLMRWWKDAAPNEPSASLVARVVENLAEALTPLRVIGERVAAGRPLGDRLELTGVLPLLKVMCAANLKGTLAINDGWNIFEIVLDRGGLRSAFRRGMGDDETAGEAALFEAAMCDFGRWTFRAQDASTGPANLKLPMARAVAEISRRVGFVFGPDAIFAEGATAEVAVRLDRLRDIASTSSGLSHQLCEVVGVGASKEEMRHLLKEGEDRLVIERTTIALMRCGALFPLAPDESVALEPDAARSAETASRLLAWLAAEHRMRSDKPRESRASAQVGNALEGYYCIAKPQEERIALGAAEGIVAPGAWRPSMTAELVSNYHVPPGSLGGGAGFSEHPTPAIQEDSAAWYPRRKDATATGDLQRGVPPLFDSFAPGPPAVEERSRRNLWIALLLALGLGALLALGIFAVSSGGRDTATNGSTP